MTLSTINVTQPLDLRTIFVDYFSGNSTIFFWISIIFFAYLGAKFRMPNLVFGFLMVIYCILMAALGVIDWIVAIIVFVALMIFLAIAKHFKY